MLKIYLTFAAEMHQTVAIFTCSLKKKVATVLLIMVSVAAFATLGDGGSKKSISHSSRNLLSGKNVYNYKNFSLKSGYTYRGSTILSLADDNKFLILNRVITYQKGNTTYILPLKKKVILDKIKFTPSRF